MPRFTLRLASVLVPVSLALLSAPAAHAQLAFDLSLTDGSTTNSIGSILLASDPGDGTYLFSDQNPQIAFTVFGFNSTPYHFTQSDITNPPAYTQFVLSTEGSQRRFQFLGTDPTAPFVFFDKNDNGNIFEVSFDTMDYRDTSEIRLGYNALTSAAAVPEPGAVALAAGLAVTGANFMRKRRRSR